MKDKNKDKDKEKKIEQIFKDIENLDKEHECDCNSCEGCSEACHCHDEEIENDVECLCDDCVDEEISGKNRDYLKDFQRTQAEFDNYRKRMQSVISDAKQDGFMDAVVGFLPALDSFKMATDMITDNNILVGIKFIEKGILDTLAKMGVDAIDTTGKFDPELHQAIEAETTGLESGQIIKEAYKGFTYKGKVIRYSQVIVEK